MRKARIFDVDVGGATVAMFGALRRAAFTRRSEAVMARQMRVALRDMLEQIIRDAARDGSFPTRSGAGLRATRGGARAFGQSFNSLRGHIVGPAYLKLLEEGGTLLPVNAEALTIPMEYALRADGTPKLRSPRQWQNILKTFIYKSKKTGRAYIAFKNGEGRLTLLYMLIDAAEFKGRQFLANAWSRRIDDLVNEFGQIMLAEASQIDLMKLARVTHKGRRV